MSVWASKPVANQPEADLVRWQIYQVENGDRHLSGYEINYSEGRASSKIASFDPKTARCVTSSGRVYQLHGEPGQDRDAEYVWHRWCAINDVTTCKNVSEEIWQQIQNSK